MRPRVNVAHVVGSVEALPLSGTFKGLDSIHAIATSYIGYTWIMGFLFSPPKKNASLRWHSKDQVDQDFRRRPCTEGRT